MWGGRVWVLVACAATACKAADDPPPVVADAGATTDASAPDAEMRPDLNAADGGPATIFAGALSTMRLDPFGPAVFIVARDGRIIQQPLPAGVPVVIAMAPPSTSQHLLAVAEHDLYVLAVGPGREKQIIWKVARQGGPLTEVASTLDGVGALEVNGSGLYWIQHTPLEGYRDELLKLSPGTSQPKVLLSERGIFLRALALDPLNLDQSLYLRTTNGDMTVTSLIKIPNFGGGSGTTLATDIGGGNGALALDDQYVFFTKGGKGPGPDGAILAVSTGGGQVTTVVADVPYPTHVAISRSHVFWDDTDDHGRVRARPRDHGAPSTLAAGDGPWALASGSIIQPSPIVYFVTYAGLLRATAPTE
jgi:hypothetical protein